MFFGDFPDELRQGATNAVQTCLGIKAGEHVALIADRASRDVAAAIEQALADQGAITSPILIESVVGAADDDGASRRFSTRSSRLMPGFCASSPRKASSAPAWRSSRSSSDGGSAMRTWSA